MKKIVLLSGHYYGSKRKAGFHFLAKSFLNKGYEVVFVTSVFSFLKIIKNDYKLHEKKFITNIFRSIKIGGVKSVINFTISHPIHKNSDLLERFTSFFYKLNRKVKNELRDADYIVFESVQSILFFQQIKSINPHAMKIYRMSDDMEVINFPPAVINHERKIIKEFDLVSIPTKVIFDKFYKITPRNVILNYHGIDKEMFDKVKTSPYQDSINHVFVGNSYLDENFIQIASCIFRDQNFHIIGPFTKNIHSKNVFYYGEMPFIETIPYIKFATTGLQIRKDNGLMVTKTLGDSLKVLQYTYCNLPIIAPSLLQAKHRKNFFYYEYNDKYSIKFCIKEAIQFRTSDPIPIDTWDDLTSKLINSL